MPKEPRVDPGREADADVDRRGDFGAVLAPIEEGEGPGADVAYARLSEPERVSNRGQAEATSPDYTF